MVRVGATARTPIVAAVAGSHGEAMLHPVRRDTAEPAHAIVEAVPDSAVKVNVPVDELYERRALVAV